MKKEYTAKIRLKGLVLALSRNENGGISRCFIAIPKFRINKVRNMFVDCIFENNNLIPNNRNIKCGDVISGIGVLDTLLDGWFMLSGDGTSFEKFEYNKIPGSPSKKYRFDVNEYFKICKQEANYMSCCNEFFDVIDKNYIINYLNETTKSDNNFVIECYGIKINEQTSDYNNQHHNKDIYLIATTKCDENSYPLCIIANNSNSKTNQGQIRKIVCSVKKIDHDGGHGLSVLKAVNASFEQVDQFSDQLITDYHFILKSMSYVVDLESDLPKYMKAIDIKNCKIEIEKYMHINNISTTNSIYRCNWANNYVDCHTILDPGIDNIIIRLFASKDNGPKRIFVYKKYTMNNGLYDIDNTACAISISNNPQWIEGNYKPDDKILSEIYIWINKHYDELYNMDYTNLKKQFLERRVYSTSVHNESGNVLNILYDSWNCKNSLLILSYDNKILARIRLPEMNDKKLSILDGSLTEHESMTVLQKLQDKGHGEFLLYFKRTIGEAEADDPYIRVTELATCHVHNEFSFEIHY